MDSSSIKFTKKAASESYVRLLKCDNDEHTIPLILWLLFVSLITLLNVVVVAAAGWYTTKLCITCITRLHVSVDLVVRIFYFCFVWRSKLKQYYHTSSVCVCVCFYFLLFYLSLFRSLLLLCTSLFHMCFFFLPFHANEIHINAYNYEIVQQTYLVQCSFIILFTCSFERGTIARCYCCYFIVLLLLSSSPDFSYYFFNVSYTPYQLVWLIRIEWICLYIDFTLTIYVHIS